MESVAKDEAVLNLKFPQQYIEFLQELGSGGLFGVDIFGVTKTSYRTHVTETLHYREYSLPKNFLIVENCDAWVYCIDCNTGEVVSWDNPSGYSDFLPIEEANAALPELIENYNKTHDTNKARKFLALFI